MMWLSPAKLAFSLACAQTVSSKAILSRQEQCNSAINSAAYSACAMQAAFGGSSVISELIPAFSPEAALSVTFGNIVIGGAQQLSPAKVFDAPSLALSFVSNTSESFTTPYVIVGLDYQAETQSISFFWIQSALQVDQDTGVLSSSMAPIVPYTSPNPLPGTGTHEFILFVYVDTGLRTFFDQSPRLLTMSSVSEFKSFLADAELDNQLVAGSYFKSTYDGLEIDGQTPASLKILQNEVNQKITHSLAKQASKGSSRIKVVKHDSPRINAGTHESPRISAVVQGSTRTSAEMHETSRIHADKHEDSRVNEDEYEVCPDEEEELA